MRPTDIKPRHIYCNRGQGTVLRFVLGIGEFVPASWHGMSIRPGEPGVRFIDSKGRKGVLYLKSFASWCGECVAIERGDSFELTGTYIDLTALATFKEL